MVMLSPRAARVRRLMIQHNCQAVTETYRQQRLDDLDDTSLTVLADGDVQRCSFCGCWTVLDPCLLHQAAAGLDRSVAGICRVVRMSEQQVFSTDL